MLFDVCFPDSSIFGQMVSIQHLNCAKSLEMLGQDTYSSPEPGMKEANKLAGLQTLRLSVEDISSVGRAETSSKLICS